MDGSDFTRVEAVVLHIGLTLVTYWAFRQVLLLLCCASPFQAEQTYCFPPA